jgi:hypothetical protein
VASQALWLVLIYQRHLWGLIDKPRGTALSIQPPRLCPLVAARPILTNRLPQHRHSTEKESHSDRRYSVTSFFSAQPESAQ